MLFGFAAVASALVALTHAQTIVTSSASSVAPSSTESQVMPPAATQAFNIQNISSSDLFNWCHAQLNTCPQICGGAAAVNTCDDTSLQFACTCPNGTVPDCTAFTQTVPYFECQATFAQCINAHPNDAEGQATCTANQKCGTRNATAEAIAATSAAASSSASSTSSQASSASGSASATASSASASASGSSDASINTLTTGAFAAVLMAFFKLAL